MIKLINQQPCIRNLYSYIVASNDGSTGEYNISITETLFGAVIETTLYYDGEEIPQDEWTAKEGDIVEECNALAGSGKNPEWADKLQKELAEEVERRVENFLIGLHD